MHKNMQMLSHLCSIYGFIILQNITIQNRHKINFKHESLKMLTPISKHNVTKKQTKTLPIQILQWKDDHLIMIKDHLDSHIIDY